MASFRCIGWRRSSGEALSSQSLREPTGFFNIQTKPKVCCRERPGERSGPVMVKTIVGSCRRIVLSVFVMALCCAGLLAEAKKPNIIVFWGDDIGQSNISAYSRGMMGYPTPNIDRVAKEGMLFTDYYAEQSCTAGRAAFIMGQSVFRSGLSKVGLPGASAGMRAEDPTIAELLKPLGYATGQFGKNHLGDRDEHLPTMHGFDEFFGNLYHLNAEEEPELLDYPTDPEFRKKFGPRGVLHCWANP